MQRVSRILIADDTPQAVGEETLRKTRSIAVWIWYSPSAR